MSMHAHLAVPDLFLPREAAAEAIAGLRLPALEKLLARAQAAPLPGALLEAWLCAAFGVESGAVAPVTLLADGGHSGAAYWLRADPVHLILRGSELILHPISSLDADETAQYCDALNRHFADDGLYFAAPHPQRWYLRLERAPGIATHPLAQAAGRDIRAYLPQGPDALHWHKLLNEIQMLLFQHPVNQAREARGEWIVNSIWLWGGGHAPETLVRPCAAVHTDSALAAAFAKAAGVAPLPLPGGDAQWLARGRGDALIVWDGLRHAFHQGDIAAWRDSLQDLERNCISPLLRSLRYGPLEKVTLDVLGAHGSQRYTLTRAMAWRFWRPSRRMGHFSA